MPAHARRDVRQRPARVDVRQHELAQRRAVLRKVREGLERRCAHFLALSRTLKGARLPADEQTSEPWPCAGHAREVVFGDAVLAPRRVHDDALERREVEERLHKVSDGLLSRAPARADIELDGLELRRVSVRLQAFQRLPVRPAHLRHAVWVLE